MTTYTSKNGPRPKGYKPTHRQSPFFVIWWRWLRYRRAITK